MSKISLIIAREYNQRVRKRTFILTTLLMPLLFIGLMAAPMLLAKMSMDKAKEIAVIDHSGIVAPELQNSSRLTFKVITDTYEQAKIDTAYNAYFGFLVIGKDIMTNSSDLNLYSYESATIDIENDITDQIDNILETRKLQSYDIENLGQIMEDVKTSVKISTFQIDETGAEKESSSLASMGVAYVAGFMIYMFIFLYGAMVMQGVIEEKSNRVVEVIVSSVRPYELMMGKILGIAAVAMTQLMIWSVLLIGFGMLAPALMGGGGDAAAGADMSAKMGSLMTNLTDVWFIAKVMGGFILFFIGGYLLYSAMFAAIGSAVDNVADTQQLQMPVTIPLVLGLIVMLNAMKEPNGPLAFWFSIIPFTSPIVMMARIPYGVPVWELILSVVLLYGSFIGMTWVAAKIFRTGIFMYGKKPSIKEIIKWSRYKG